MNTRRMWDKFMTVDSVLSCCSVHLSLTPWSGVLEKQTGSQLVKKLTIFYGIRMFITAFRSASHLSLS